MNLNKLRYSVQSSIPTGNIGVALRDLPCDPPEIQKQVDTMEGLKAKLKNVRDITAKQAAHLRQESATKRSHAAMMEAGQGGSHAGPTNLILQRITEFSNLTSGNSMMLAENIASSVSDPCGLFIREEMMDAKKKKDLYDKAKQNYYAALEQNKHAETALKKASQKDKMFFQEKFRDSGKDLDEAQDRFETMTREVETSFKIVNEMSSTVVVKALLSYLETFYEYHETCFTWLKTLMETESIKNWRNFVKEKEAELVKRKAAGAGPSKKVYGNPISELSQFDKEMNPKAIPIPTPIFKIMRFLNNNCLDQEGIFRLSGNQNEVDVERRKIDAWAGAGGGDDYPAGTDPHVLASLLKKYFRELPEPLLTYDLFDEFLATKGIPEDQACASLNQCVQKLPETNRATFHAICQLASNVEAHSEKNMMTATNLGVCFAPSILYGRADDPSALEKSIDANNVITFIIQHVDEVFQGETRYLPKASAAGGPSPIPAGLPPLSPGMSSSPSRGPASPRGAPPPLPSNPAPSGPPPLPSNPAPSGPPPVAPKRGGASPIPIPARASPNPLSPSNVSVSVSPVAGGGPPPLPSREVGGEWSEHVTEEGNTYWYNTVTGVSTWTNPHLKPSHSAPSPAPLPDPNASSADPNRRKLLSSSGGGGGIRGQGTALVMLPVNPQSTLNPVVGLPGSPRGAAPSSPHSPMSGRALPSVTQPPAYPSPRGGSSPRPGTGPAPPPLSPLPPDGGEGPPTTPKRPPPAGGVALPFK